MTKTNLNKDKIKFNNLFKSFFSDIENISCNISDDNVIIYEDSKNNPDPASVEFCENAKLNYVSCSPYRVPIARLAAAQAFLKKK